MKINKRILIMRSGKYGYNCMTMGSCRSIFNILSQIYNDVSIISVSTIEDVKQAIKLKPDLIFIGTNTILDESGERIWLSTYFDNLGIAYTGSTTTARRLGLNKHLAKQSVISAGLNSPKFVISDGTNTDIQELSYPLFVKPKSRGGGQGIDSQSIVMNRTSLNSKILSIFESWKSLSLVEEFLPGREFTVAVIMDQSTNKLIALPIELIAEQTIAGENIMSREAKNSNTDTAFAISDQIIIEKVKRLAIESFVALSGRDYGVIDIRLDASGEPSFLEANFMPSLVESSGNFPRAWRINNNQTHQDMIIAITNLALNR